MFFYNGMDCVAKSSECTTICGPEREVASEFDSTHLELVMWLPTCGALHYTLHKDTIYMRILKTHNTQMLRKSGVTTLAAGLGVY